MHTYHITRKGILLGVVERKSPFDAGGALEEWFAANPEDKGTSVIATRTSHE